MSDLIRRDEALMCARPEYLNPQQEKLASYNQGWNNAVEMYYKQIAELPSAEPNEYVKDGTLTVQMPTIKEAKAVDKTVVYADTYKQEYHKPKVGAWIDDEEYNTEYGYYFAHCSECSYQIDVHENRGYHNYCPNCGAKMERSE